jgi:hypothetical protein
MPLRHMRNEKYSYTHMYVATAIDGSGQLHDLADLILGTVTH